jgi:hypothetical protein
MSLIEQTLERLALMFTVRDIMTAVPILVTAPSEEMARQTSERHPDYDVIPILKKGSSENSFTGRRTPSQPSALRIC